MAKQRKSRLSLLVPLWLLSQPAGAVNLGGQEVPRDRLIVYLFIGNCNMVGRDTSCDTQTHPRTWNYQLKDYNHASTAGWIPAKDPLHADTSSKVRGGPAMPFLKRMVERYPEEYYFAALHNGDAGSTVHSYQPGEKLYEEIVRAAQQVQQEATLGGVVMMTGENESHNRSTAENFDQLALKLMQAMRDDLSLPGLPFFINSFHQNESGRGRFWSTLATQMKTVATTVPQAAVVDYQCPSNGFIDSIHLSRDCYVSWSNELVDNIIHPGQDGAWNHAWYPATSIVDDPVVSPQAPKAVISAPPIAERNQEIELDGSGSTDDGQITAYQWDLGDGQGQDGPQIRYAWSEVGRYTIQLTVTDDAGQTGQAQVEIEVVASAQPAIQILSPRNGDSWPSGSTQMIRWSIQHLNDVKLFYSVDDGQSWEVLGYSDADSDDWCALAWQVPTEPCTACRILIEGYDGETPTQSAAFKIVTADDDPRVIGGCHASGTPRPMKLLFLSLILAYWAWRNQNLFRGQ